MVVSVDASFVAYLPPPRPNQTHKGDFGRVALLCGSTGYTGAARLAAEGCLRSGAGLIELGVPRSIYPILAAACPPEVMCRPLPDDGAGRLSYDALPDILSMLDRCDAALAGPGLGRSASLDKLVRCIADRRPAPLVLDADGLGALAGHAPAHGTAPLLLTPHDGEFRKLGGTDSQPPNRALAAIILAQQLDAVVVRKGHVTLTVSPDGAVYANTTGNPGMAKGGSGDLLAGFLAGLIAQKAKSPELWHSVDWAALAACAVYWHGRAGDLCARVHGQYGMSVTDIAGKLPEAMNPEV